jgi:hypothetical protein
MDNVQIRCPFNNTICSDDCMAFDRTSPPFCSIVNSLKGINDNLKTIKKSLDADGKPPA